MASQNDMIAKENNDILLKNDPNNRTPAHVKHAPVLCSISLKAQVNYEKFLDILKDEFERKRESKITRPETLENFEILQMIGEESASVRISLGRSKTNNIYYAFKIYLKEAIIKSKTKKQLLSEKRLLQAFHFPFVINLEFCFKDNNYIYMVMPFMIGGDLFSQLKRLGRFNENQAKFYASQIILALEYLHHMGVIHRDLKLENILVDKNGYLKLTDFSFSKITDDRTATFCGTPEYIAPEIIMGKTYGKAADWWSFGVLLYEMVSGHTPFYANDTMKLYEKIVQGKYKFDEHIGNDIKDLIRNILQTDPSRRYGNLYSGILDYKHHRWFLGTNWTAMLNRKVEAPIIPKVKGPGDTIYFNKYHEVPLKISPENQYEKEFEDF